MYREGGVAKKRQPKEKNPTATTTTTKKGIFRAISQQGWLLRNTFGEGGGEDIPPSFFYFAFPGKNKKPGIEIRPRPERGEQKQMCECYRNENGTKEGKGGLVRLLFII